MKEFSNGSFSPDTIKIMTAAMEGAISTLPHPVASGWTQALAESIPDSAISLRRMVLPCARAGARGGAVETRLSACPTAFGGGVWGS